MTDFAADAPFGRVSDKLQEHYGITAPTSSARLVTLEHANSLTEKETLPAKPDKVVHLQLISEVDGSMIPIVSRVAANEVPPLNDAGEPQKRRRQWMEARLTTAQAFGVSEPLFGVTTGTVQEAGAMMGAVAHAVGITGATKVHGVADGATWIKTRFDEQFGSSSTFVLDLYHVSEYLAEAAKVCAPDAPRAWVLQQMDRLREGKAALVTGELNMKANHGPREVPDPVFDCLRYLLNRPGQLDYPRAIAAGLPTGSGEIESANKQIVQARLKVAGAWWDLSNATSVLKLRCLRANRQWNRYGENEAKAA